jgi:quinol monooxygenase YgiN
VTYRFREPDLRITRNETGGIVYYLLEDVERGVRHRLYELEYETARLLDGKRSAEKVARIAAKKLGLHAQAVDIDRFAQQLVALGFVTDE